jgi:hypothetical protein
MNSPYMIGRRNTVKVQASVKRGPATNLRAEDGKRTVLRTMGWSAATFGAGAVLGWLVKAKRKDQP